MGSNSEKSNKTKQSRSERRRIFLAGVRDGTPIAVGYFAVSFTLGIAARNAGLTVWQGVLASLLNNASAGEYAGFLLISSQASYLETALVMFVTNIRYLLMSCALSQKFSSDTSLIHRLLVGFDVTDELFGISIAKPGYLDPLYSYGAMLVSIPCWATGTGLGVLAGNLLPLRAVSALSVALYGMFIAVIIPPARKNHVIFGIVLVSFAASFLCDCIPFLTALSDGMRVIILTVLISCIAAILFPADEVGKKDEHAA